jgi:hypothetical protein
MNKIERFLCLSMVLTAMGAFFIGMVSLDTRASDISTAEASENLSFDRNVLDDADSFPASRINDLVKIILKNLESQSRSMESVRVSLETINDSLDDIRKIMERWGGQYIIGEDNGR